MIGKVRVFSKCRCHDFVAVTEPGEEGSSVVSRPVTRLVDKPLRQGMSNQPLKFKVINKQYRVKCVHCQKRTWKDQPARILAEELATA